MLVGSPAHVGQPAAAPGVADADAVVAHGEGDAVRAGVHLDRDRPGAGVPGDVGQGLAEHREQVVHHLGGQGVEQAGQPHRGIVAERGRDVRDHLQQPAPHAIRQAVHGLLQRLRLLDVTGRGVDVPGRTRRTWPAGRGLGSRPVPAAVAR